MTVFNPQLAEIRFGCGLSPVVAPPVNVAAMLNGLTGPDITAQQFPIEPFSEFLWRMESVRLLWQQRRKVRGTPKEKVLAKDIKLVKKSARQGRARWLCQTLLRRAHSPTAFRERLAFFWADHFTAHGKAGVVKRATSPYIEDAIRPNMTGRFSDMLIACVTHPVMLHYLDQHKAMGPNSVRARKDSKPRGLNENLAREVLELHTLGVGGPYSQSDVRELAELFTGMTFKPRVGFAFRASFAEPGPETVLDKTYPEARDDTAIRAVLQDLAVHPATARHLSVKLATHFVSDNPDTDLIAHMAARYLETQGDLMALYTAMLEHPTAWTPDLQNAKLPVDFIASALRALALAPTVLDRMDEKTVRQVFLSPMAQMGQTWQEPLGADGWPEEDSAWFTPQGLSARISWAMQAPERLVPDLPDPRVFVKTALGERANDTLRFAASAAESKPEAIGLILSSPAFQRR